MKQFILAGLIAASPLLVQAADINIEVGSARIQTPGGNLGFGSRDSRGNYWDGGDWRDRDYWERHHGPRGEKYYTGRPQGVPFQGKGGFCPPGQAKKGNCFGIRDSRGNFWDGGDWRDRDYWERHHGPRGEKYYTGRLQGMPQPGTKGFCPPGQAKKGNC